MAGLGWLREGKGELPRLRGQIYILGIWLVVGVVMLRMIIKFGHYFVGEGVGFNICFQGHIDLLGPSAVN